MTKPPLVTLVAAMALGNAIGRGNTLPWHIPEELKLFRRLTLNKTVLMGRKTAESIGKALPQRRNLVLTSGDAPYPGQTVVRSLEEALSLCDDELMVIGGAQVYNLALPIADRLCLTHVDMYVRDADAFFPNVDPMVWKSFSIMERSAVDTTPAFNYREYLRRGNKANQ